MTILTVENNKKALSKLSDMIRTEAPDAEILCFESSPQALAAAREQRVDVAFLNMKMKEIDGMILGQYLRDLNSYVNLIYLTDQREDAFDAMSIRASGCLLYPVKEKAV